MKDFLNKEREEFEERFTDPQHILFAVGVKQNLSEWLKAHDTRVVEKVVEMIDGMEKPLCRCICDNTRRANAYNHALKDLLEALKDM